MRSVLLTVFVILAIMMSGCGEKESSTDNKTPIINENQNQISESTKNKNGNDSVERKEKTQRQKGTNSESGSAGLRSTLDGLNKNAESAYGRILDDFKNEVENAKKNGGNSSGNTGGNYGGTARYTGPDFGRGQSTSVCSKCKGAGTVMCTSCKGVGKQYYRKSAPNYGGGRSNYYTQTIQCPTCRGTGSSTCTLCGGSGGR